MLNDLRLSNLPGYAKLFVGIFTTLMLFVVFWAMFILYVSKGRVDKNSVLPAYVTHSPARAGDSRAAPGDSFADMERQQTAEQLQEDSLAVLAPIWDSSFAGREVHVDSVTNLKEFRERDSQASAELSGWERPLGGETRFRHNLGLAHTHVNGQTLLYFAIGLLFLFTSAPPTVKKAVYWIFGISILLHAIGLTGQGYFGFFDDLLAISGIALLAVVVYMAVLVYVDLGRKRDTENV